MNAPKPVGANVAIYLRVSSLEQADKGWSIEGQRNEIREFCDREGSRVVRIYKDLGYSGADIERPSLQKMLEHSCQGQFEKLIIWKYDRLSRNNMDFPALIHFLNKNNVEVVSVKEPTPNDNSPYNEFIIGILGLIASLERRVFLMRSRMGMTVRLKNGFYKGSPSPYGYDYNPATGHLEINETESKAVREIFQKYSEMRTLNRVKNYCQEMGYPTKRGAKWRINTVKQILENRVYLGYYIYKDIETHHEEVQLVEEGLFNTVQQILQERSQYRVKNREFREVPKDSISFAYNGDDPVIQEFLEKKVEMPLCPRCSSNLQVCKWGWYDSPTVGRLQQYYCKPCNYEFMEFPSEEVKNDMPHCPKCHEQRHVRKEGNRMRKTMPPLQKYTCTRCKYWFE